MIVINLRCEYLTNPLGMDVLQPRLSWIVQSSERNQIQTAYQVLVAGTRESLDADRGDCWDSGKVESNRTAHVLYEGKSLVSEKTYHWKVRVWDRDGAVSEWSEPAFWSMGLLMPEDWQAQWIGAPQADRSKPNDTQVPSPLLRKTFSIEKKVRQAKVYVTALGYYDLTVNGHRVGDRVLTPEWTDYKRRVQYQTYQVADLLQSGKNVLGAMLADGWYAGRLGPTRWDKEFPKRGVYGFDRRLFLRLSIELEDGSRQTVVSDGSWSIHLDGPIQGADNFLGETYDARKEVPGWDLPNYDDSQWQKVAVDDAIDLELNAQRNEPIRVVKELKPIALFQPQPEITIFDMGQNMVGWCRIRLEGPAGTEIKLRHGEMLTESGELYTDNLTAAVQTDTFILNDDGPREYVPRFTYHGFRYVEVTGAPKALALDSLIGMVVASDTPVTGSFDCSNPLLNQLWNNILWTQRGNMHSTPTDCPQRDERMGWMGDAQVFSQTSIFNMEMAAFFTKWCRDIRDAQTEDGRFPDFAPNPYHPTIKFTNAPGWADAGAIVPWRVYQNYGDRRLLEEQFEAARRFIDCIHRENPDLIQRNAVGNQYGDWLNGDTIKAEGYPTQGGAILHEIYATAFFAYSTRIVAQMADVLDRENDANTYGDLADRIRDRFVKAFVDQDGRIAGDTQAAYALALNFQLLPENLRPLAARHMMEAVEKYDGRISTGIQSTIRLMLELSRWGYNDMAYRLIESRRFPSWLYSIDQGATTIWERWDGYVAGRGFQDAGMNSFNHYAIGSVGEWMYKVLLGIRPDDAHPGYERFTIQPQPGGTLVWAKGLYHSIRGPIAVAWERQGSRFMLEVDIPANTRATVVIPARDDGTITEGGQVLSDVAGVTLERMESGAAVLSVGSGRYSFVSE